VEHCRFYLQLQTFQLEPRKRQVGPFLIRANVEEAQEIWWVLEQTDGDVPESRLEA
jgi:hypothetical protein